MLNVCRSHRRAIFRPMVNDAENILSLQLGFELLAARYLFVAVATTWLWDLLVSLADDIRMVEKCGVQLPDIIYILSRISTCAYVILAVFFIATPISSCQAMVNSIGWFAAFSVAFNNILFLIRIRGVYFRAPYVSVAFLTLWLTTLATFTAPFSFTALTITPTAYCAVVKIERLVTAGVVATAVYDTAVFVAISIRLVSFCVGNSWREKLRNFMESKDLAAVSNLLWSTGLLYYIPVIAVNIFSMTILFMPSIAVTYRSMCPIPEIALQNIMACRVYRDLKLGFLYDDPTDIPTQQTFSIEFASPPSQLDGNFEREDLPTRDINRRSSNVHYMGS